MQDAGHLLTNKDFNRVAEVVRRVEGTYNSASQSAQSQSGSNVQVLQIQAGASNSFGYPARIQKWSNSGGTWSDLSTTEVRVEEANGATLSASQYVLGRFIGINASDVGCFVIGYPVISVPTLVLQDSGLAITITQDAAANDLISFDLTEAGLYEINANFVTYITRSSYSQSGQIIFQATTSGAGVGTAYGASNSVDIVNATVGHSDGVNYHSDFKSTSRTFWVNVTSGTVTVKGRFYSNVGCSVDSLLYYPDYTEVWARRISNGGIVSSLVATVGSTSVTNATANGLLYVDSGGVLRSAAATPVNGLVVSGSGGPEITNFTVGAIASQLWQNLR